MKTERKHISPNYLHKLHSPDCDIEDVWQTPGTGIEKTTVFSVKHYYEFRWTCPKCGWKSSKVRKEI